MTHVPRVSPEEIYAKVQAGETLLVCAYDDEDKFRQLHLAGALSLSHFRKRWPALSPEQDVVFYCA
jgi:hypothetical protein